MTGTDSATNQPQDLKQPLSRYFIKLAYDGAPYHGWQSQPGGVATVQSAIEGALSTLLRQPMAVTGAGRTDTGVNARLMYAHTDLPSGTDTDSLPRRLNAILGPSIAIDSFIRVTPEAHARFDATSRTYRYFIHHSRNPFLNYYSLFSKPLDYEKMNEAAARLLSVSDFTSFAKLHTDNRTNICRLTHARWEPLEGDGDRSCFVITADRFLRNMVRAVVGTLLDVGRGKLSADGFEAVIEGRDRCLAGTSVPPHPLFLWDITYPTSILPRP